MDYECTIAISLSSYVRNEFMCVVEIQGLEDDGFRMDQECIDKNWEKKKEFCILDLEGHGERLLMLESCNAN